ncbi:InlB B-repeat-containing protein [Paracholeplasma vituli]|nr:InlB B-repeat-containing protein [Paracholeplasma vituli]
MIFFVLVGCQPNQKVEVTFETNSGSTIKAVTSITQLREGMPTTTKSGYEFAGWYTDETLTQAFDPLTNRTNWVFTIYAKWTPNDAIYHIEHYHESLTGSFVLFETEDKDTVVGASVSIETKNYTGFTYQTGNASNVSSGVIPTTGELTLKAYYERNTYSVIIDENGGDTVSDLAVKYEDTITLPTLSRVGYTFLGYESNPTTMGSSNITVKALWEAIPQYTITFDSKGGSNISNQTIYKNSKVTLPTPPTKVGYTFNGWKKLGESTNYNFDTLVQGAFTLEAVWVPAMVDVKTEIYTEGLDGLYVLAQTITHQALTESITNASNPTLNGFIEDQTHTNRNVSGTSLADGSLVLKRYYSRSSFTISFESNAAVSIESITAKFESVISKPTDPIKMGYTFNGWFTDTFLTVAYTFSTMPSENKVLYAKWTPESMSLHFNTLGGSTIESIVAPYQSSVSKPTDPTKLGYTFDGWYLEATYETAYNTWVMPLGNITVYAKWTPNDYTLVFNTNGGSTLADLVAPYLSEINPPANPTKPDYIFLGWYSDILLETEFEFDVMPLNGTTIYAKWISVESELSLALVKGLDDYTEVKVRGEIVLLSENVDGFYISDGTITMFVLYYDETLVMGDTLEFDAILTTVRGIRMLARVQNLLLTEDTFDSLTPEILTIDEISTLNIQSEGKVIQTTGILASENGLMLIDLDNYQSLIISRNYNYPLYAQAIGKYVEVTGILHAYSDTWVIALTSVEILPLEQSTVETMIIDYLDTLFTGPFYSKDEFSFVDTDPWFLTWIEFMETASLLDYYEPVEQRFNLLTESVEIILEATIHMGENTVSYNKTITVHAHDPLTILEFNNLEESGRGVVTGLITLAEPDHDIYVIFDGTNYLYIEGNAQMNYGDTVEILLTKDTYQGMPYGYYHEDDYLVILSENNPVPVVESYGMDELDHASIGEFIELRGFMTNTAPIEFHGEFALFDGTHTVVIQPASYSGFESLFQYQGLEVILRGYLASNDGAYYIYYAGERNEVRIPEYSDEERVQMIYTVFSNLYGEHQFEAYEPFELTPYHPYLGGEITYTFLEGGSYYDYEHEYFTYAHTDQTIKISMEITIGSVSSTFTYETHLKKPEITTVEDFKSSDYGFYYVSGLVVYRTPSFAFLEDETGLLMIEGYDLPLYKGDRVVVYGNVSKAYPDYVNTTLYFDSRDRDIPLVVYRLEPETNVEMTSTLMTWEDILTWRSNMGVVYHRYFEISGYLTASGDEYYLTFGNQVLTIYAVDWYTQNKLIPHLNQYVTIKLLTTRHDGSGFEYLYLGNEGDIETMNYSESEMNQLINEWIDALWALPLNGNQQLRTMKQPQSTTITYEMAEGYETYIDFDFSFVKPVNEPTEVHVIATYTLGETVYTHPVTVLIIPTSGATYLSIMDAKASIGQKVTIEGNVMVNFPYDSNYSGSILFDGSDYVLVKYPKGTYLYGTSNIGYKLTATGIMRYEQDRYTFEIQSSLVSYQTFDFGSLDVWFSLETLYTTDHTLDTYLGKFAEIEGYLTYDNAYYYLTRDGMTIRLETFYDTDYFLYPLTGLKVRVKGFVIGRAQDGSDNISLAVSHYAYIYSENSIELAETDILTVLDKIADQMVGNRYDEPYIPGEYISFTTYQTVLPDATITYEPVVAPKESTVDMYDSYWIYMGDYEDQIIDVLLTVSYNGESVSRIFRIELIGLTPTSLDALFDPTLPFEDITLIATVLYEGFDFSYYEIDGDVYYYNGYIGGYSEIGTIVLINGKKSTLDGVTNYSYNVITSTLFDNEIPNYSVIQLDIEDILNINLSTQDIRKNAILVMGKLGYDPYSDYFTLTDDLGHMIYIRHHIEDEYETKNDDRDGTNFLHRYLDDYIIIELFYPNMYTQYDQVLMDFLGGKDAVMLPEWTIEEELDIVESIIKTRYDGKTYMSGESLDLPHYNEIHDIELTYTKKNSLDTGIYLETYYSWALWVEQETSVDVTVTMKIYNPLTQLDETRSFDITLVIQPIEISTIVEILYGVTGDTYVFEGIVEAIDPTTFMIIKDDTGRIYIELNSNRDLPTLSIGDEVRILGLRNLYDYEDYIPVISEIYDLQILSTGHIVNPVYIPTTMADILAIDYLLPDVYNQTVSITGTVIFTGNSWYPSYDLVIDDDYSSTYSIQLIGQDYDTFNAYMDPLVGQTMTIEGYLIGFTYIYDLFDWKVVVINSTVIS